MSVLWVDAGNGAAGDMLLAALIDAGASLDAIRTGLHRLAVEPVTLTVTEVRRHGLRAALATVDAPETTVHRGLSGVVGIIDGAGLPGAVGAYARATFVRLARAEARVHGVPVDDVHFHEVGALDAIADVVGCALALYDLGLLDSEAARIVSPVAAGSGTVHTGHGPLPVPVPAVLELLTAAGAPMRHHPAERELCTPTGAALLTELATGWGSAPGGTPRAVGVGAGRADPPAHANVLRVVVGDAAPAPDWATATLYQVESTVDDMDPRLWPDLLDELRTAGAADAWCTPVLMRKGRPGQQLTVLVDADRLDLVCGLVFTRTTTLGVRIAAVERRSLHRDEVTVGGVRVKRGYLGGELVTVQPEYEDARRHAARTGRPLAHVLDEARHAARSARAASPAGAEVVGDDVPAEIAGLGGEDPSAGTPADGVDEPA